MKKIMMGMMGMLFLVSVVYATQGINMHMQIASEEAKLHELQAEYFSLAKADRDSAATGSELNSKLVLIQQYPSELLRLKLVGVGKILTGIYVLLFGILIALIMMPVQLDMIIKNRK